MGMTESEWAEPVWQQNSWIIQRLDALTARVVELSAQVDEHQKMLDALGVRPKYVIPPPPPAPPK